MICPITEDDFLGFWLAFKRVVMEDFPEYPLSVRQLFVGRDFVNTYLKKEIKDWDFMVWLAKEEKEIAGFLVAEKIYGGVSYANWVGVLPEYRRRGIGSELIRFWERKVGEEKGHKLLLVAPSDGRRQFYLKQGFKEEGLEEKSWYGVNHWLFGKLIAQPDSNVVSQGLELSNYRKK